MRTILVCCACALVIGLSCGGEADGSQGKVPYAEVSSLIDQYVHEHALRDLSAGQDEFSKPAPPSEDTKAKSTKVADWLVDLWRQAPKHDYTKAEVASLIDDCDAFLYYGLDALQGDVATLDQQLVVMRSRIAPTLGLPESPEAIAMADRYLAGVDSIKAELTRIFSEADTVNVDVENAPHALIAWAKEMSVRGLRRVPANLSRYAKEFAIDYFDSKCRQAHADVAFMSKNYFMRGPAALEAKAEHIESIDKVLEQARGKIGVGADQKHFAITVPDGDSFESYLFDVWSFSADALRGRPDQRIETPVHGDTEAKP